MNKFVKTVADKLKNEDEQEILMDNFKKEDE